MAVKEKSGFAEIPALFRRIRSFSQPQRLRLETPDDDFLDVDCWRQGSRRLAVLSHGLEGSSRASYIRGTAAMLVNLTRRIG